MRVLKRRWQALIHAAVATGKIVNLKKGQFLSPAEMAQVARKATAAGGKKLILTERGTTFGYQDLVVDYRNIPWMKAHGVRVVMEAPKPALKSPPYRCFDWFNRNNPVCHPGLTVSRVEVEERRSVGMRRQLPPHQRGTVAHDECGAVNPDGRTGGRMAGLPARSLNHGPGACPR